MTRDMSDWPRIELIRGVSASTWNSWSVWCGPIWILAFLLANANRSNPDMMSVRIPGAIFLISGLGMCVFALLTRWRRLRELKAGYTTLFKRNEVSRVDPKTGLVLYQAGDGDPDGSEWKEMKGRAKAYRKYLQRERRR